MYEHKKIPPFFDFLDFTAVLPKFYWDVYSAEQRIHEICKMLGKLVAYANAINEHANNLDDAFVDWNDRLVALDEYAHNLEIKFNKEQAEQTAELKEYTDAQVLALDIALRELINNITIDNIPVLDPEDSEMYKNLDQVLQYNYNNLRYLAASAQSIDKKEFTAQKYDNENLLAYVFDFYSTCELLNGDGVNSTFDGSYFLKELDKMIGDGSTSDIREQVNQNTNDIKKNSELDEQQQRQIDEQKENLKTLNSDVAKIKTTVDEELQEVIQQVATNTDNITANTTNITTNTTDIANLDTRVDTIEPQVETNTSDIANFKTLTEENINDIKILKFGDSSNLYGYGNFCKIKFMTGSNGLKLNTTQTSYNPIYTDQTTNLTYYGLTTFYTSDALSLVSNCTMNGYFSKDKTDLIKWQTDVIPSTLKLQDSPRGGTEIKNIWLRLIHVKSTRAYDLNGIITVSMTIKTATITDTPQIHAIATRYDSTSLSSIPSQVLYWGQTQNPVYKFPSANSNEFINVSFNFRPPTTGALFGDNVFGFLFSWNDSIESIFNLNIDWLPFEPTE